MHLTNNLTIQQAVEQLFLAPLQHPEIIPSVLPLIVGAVVIELYFGKHPQEKLGWNTSVGNAMIWTATGLNLLVTSKLNMSERYAVYSLLGIGGLVGYMNFYHKWSSSIAYIISSSGIVYSLAYIIVVMVKTDIAVTTTTLKAGAVFLVAVNMGFKLIQGFERPVQDEFGFNR